MTKTFCEKGSNQTPAGYPGRGIRIILQYTCIICKFVFFVAKTKKE